MISTEAGLNMALDDLNKLIGNTMVVLWIEYET